MLEYDNSAFYYFAITLLTIYILPGTWYALSEFVLAFAGSGEVGSKARTQSESAKANQLKRESTGFTRLDTTAYKVNLVFLLIAWVCFLYLMAMVVNDGEVNTFDPYTILGVAQGVATSEIKKAYRKLSLKYHPDKNIGDKNAEEMFMRIAKAYEALTDEASKENYEKFGNPDGKQALEVSIGLPRIILDNPKVVLVLYLIAMVVVIPSAVGLWYANSKQYGEKNIKYDTYNAFYTLLQETFRIKNLPEVIAASAECRAINTPQPSDNEPMGLLYASMKSSELMVKPKIEHPVVLRGNLLLHAHVTRKTDNLTPILLKDLNIMLSRIPELIEGIIEISHQRKWLKLSIAAVQFSQCVIQALWTNNHSLEQLPYFGDSEVKTVVKSGSKPPVKSLSDFLILPDADKKGLDRLNDEQKQEVLRVCNIIPHLRVTTALFVEEEEKDFLEGLEDALPPVDDTASAATGSIRGDQIFEQDLVTLRITMVRENVTQGDSAHPVYAPHFPKTVRESWWIVLSDKPFSDSSAKKGGEVNIHAFEKVTEQTREVVHEVRFMAPQRAGEYEMQLLILSDCYLGLDQTHAISFSVRPASELPEYAPHPEDVELDNEPTLFEQVLASNIDEESSDEEEDGDDDAPAPTSSAGKKGDSRPVVEDVDDSEEED